MNTTMFDEIKSLNKDNSGIAILYKKRKISYRELFLRANRFAMSLYTLGYRAGDEILVSSSNLPELIILLLASLKLGCNLHPIKKEFSKEYLIKLIDENKRGYLFLSTDRLLNFARVIEDSERIKGIVTFSAFGSLKVGSREQYLCDLRKSGETLVNLNPFEVFEKSKFLEIFPTSEFDALGQEYISEYMEVDSKKHRSYVMDAIIPEKEVDDNTPLFTTYMSEEPEIYGYETVVHSKRDFNFYEKCEGFNKDLFDYVRKLKILGYVPNHVFAYFDYVLTTLYMGSTVVCEPVLSKNFFTHAIVDSCADVVIANSGYWEHFMLKAKKDSNLLDSVSWSLKFPLICGINSCKGFRKLFDETIRKKCLIHPYEISKLKNYYKFSGEKDESILLSNGEEFFLKVIDDVVDDDPRYILSCMTVKTMDEYYDEVIVIYLKFQPLWWGYKSLRDITKELIIRIDKVLPEELKEKIYIRPIFPFEPQEPFYNSYGKKDVDRCSNIGLDDRCEPYNGLRQEVVDDAKTFMSNPINK